MSPEEILEKLRTKWEELMVKADRLLEAFNTTLDKIARFAGWIAEKAVDFWNSKVVPKWQEAVDWMGEHWNVFGAPWLCFDKAADWRTDVGQPVSERAGLAAKGQLDVDNTWKGSAATRYNERLSQQESALQGVSEQFAETIASALVKVGAGIITWWLGIIVGIGILVICILTATGEAISLVCIDETDLLRSVQRMLKQAIPWTVEEGFIPDRDTEPRPLGARAGHARTTPEHHAHRKPVRRRAGAGSGR
jgi:hypothetical protein